MRAAAVIGIILIILGVISFAYQGITYTTHKKVLEVGPIHATESQHHTIPLPPVLGGLALVCGVVLLIAGGKSA